MTAQEWCFHTIRAVFLLAINTCQLNQWSLMSCVQSPVSVQEYPEGQQCMWSLQHTACRKDRGRKYATLSKSARVIKGLLWLYLKCCITNTRMALWKVLLSFIVLQYYIHWSATSLTPTGGFNVVVDRRCVFWQQLIKACWPLFTTTLPPVGGAKKCKHHRVVLM